jgi:hypothetical protein
MTDTIPTGSAASALKKIYRQIDALCIDAREAATPADNVGTGVERVLKGEDPAAVATELRAITHARELRCEIIRAAIDKLAGAAVKLEAKARNREVPALRAAGPPLSADHLKQLIDDAFNLQARRNAEVRERREREERYDAAKAKYTTAKRAYEAQCGSGAMRGFNPFEHGLTEDDMDALNPAGSPLGKYKRSDYKSPPSTWQELGR